MYFPIGFLLIFFLAIFILYFCRKKYAMKSLYEKTHCEKVHLLNELAKPFGFFYCSSQDVMTSRLDAWQKEFGYQSLYDSAAPLFNMVFDCESIYFDYAGKTWLIELWKGQYGINIGAEIGIYHANSILMPDQYEQTVFHAVADTNLFPMHMKLYLKGNPLFSVCRPHWWLTGFSMGSYCKPEDLEMKLSITFPNDQMMHSFVKSLQNLGYPPCELCTHCQKVTFSFRKPHMVQPHHIHPYISKLAQWENRIFCQLYCCLTRPFTCTEDRILYLYFFFPAIIRSLFRFCSIHIDLQKEASFRL